MNELKFVMVFASLLCGCGCVVSQSDAPVLKRPLRTDLPSIGLRGFVGQTMDVNPFFVGGSSSFSGTAYTPATGPVNYSGTGSSSYSGFTMAGRETSATLNFTAGTLADMGFPMPQNPDYIIAGTYCGPCVDWRRWYVDAAVDVGSLTFLWNVRYRSGLEIRVFDAKTGKMLTKIFEPDSYRFTSFGVIPLYGHLFCPMQWPDTLYPHCNERVTIKAVNRLTEWLENNAPMKPPKSAGR